jgi:hypothetical protein
MTLKASEDVALSAVRRMDSFNFLFMLHSQPDSRYPESKPRLFGVKVSEIILHEARAHRNTMCSLDHLVYAIHRKTCLFLTGKKLSDPDFAHLTLQVGKSRRKNRDHKQFN